MRLNFNVSHRVTQRISQRSTKNIRANQHNPRYPRSINGTRINANAADLRGFKIKIPDFKL
jgi:hypothetical protein